VTHDPGFEAIVVDQGEGFDRFPIESAEDGTFDCHGGGGLC
jgi:hypothetical protein